jgi:hypothetical protein
MKYALLVIFGLLMPRLAKSQDTIPNRWIVKANATSWLNPYFPALKMGLEKQVAKNLSISGEMGYHIIYAGYQSVDTFAIKSGGFSGNIEGRYHLKNNKKSRIPSRKYLAVNLFYISEQYNSSLDYTDISDTAYLRVRNDNFTVDKKRWGINFIYGKQKQFAKRWITDGYIGIGVRQKNIVNTHREFDTKAHKNAEIEFRTSVFDLSETSGVNINFTLGVRIGFILK